MNLVGGSGVLGQSVRRAEDAGLLTGGSRFAGDMAAAELLHLAYVRSTVAHGLLLGVETDAAAAQPGVVAVLTAADLPSRPIRHVPGSTIPEVLHQPPVAQDRVRFAGEVIAVVAAGTAAAAADAAALVEVDIDPLPAVVDPRAALAAEAPLLFPEHGTNIALSMLFEAGEPLSRVPTAVVQERFVNQRIAVAPMEPNAITVIPDADGRLTIYASTQVPHLLRHALARYFGVPRESMRVIAPTVGGGFGGKVASEVEYVLAVAAARTLDRPVRYAETRSENLALMHGRAQEQLVRILADRDGTIRRLEVEVLADAGAYPHTGSFLPTLTRLMACGVYRVPSLRFDITAALTTTAPVGAFRGAGRPEAATMIERALDRLAAELDLDPADVRRRNMLGPDEFPCRTVTGAVYDSGNYAAALEAALTAAAYDDLRKDQAARRAAGDSCLLGIGLSTYVEVTALMNGREYAGVGVGPDGLVTVRAGTSAHGQGHAAPFAQIAASVLGVPVGAVSLVEGDTDDVPEGGGTQSSRSVQLGGSAVLRAAEAVLDKARRLVAHHLEAHLDDVVLDDAGRLGVRGVPATALSWADVAVLASDPAALPDGMEPGLSAAPGFTQEGSTYPFGAHVAVVEVDPETGAVALLRLVAVDDCGTVVNPLLAEGQIHGGLAAAIGQALYEEVRYDDAGNPVTATFTDYLLPSAAELPWFETAHTVTPTPLNPLGAKGIGESGTTGAIAAVQNAVIDALAHLGVRHLDLPLTPARVWEAIQQAGRGQSTNLFNRVPTSQGAAMPRRDEAPGVALPSDEWLR